MANSPLIATVRSAEISHVAGYTTTTYTYTMIRTNNSTPPLKQLMDEESKDLEFFVFCLVLTFAVYLLLCLNSFRTQQGLEKNRTNCSEWVDVDPPGDSMAEETTEADSGDKTTDDGIECQVREEKERQTRLRSTKRLTQSIYSEIEEGRQKENERKATQATVENAAPLPSISSSKSESTKKSKAHRGRKGGRKHKKKSGDEA